MRSIKITLLAAVAALAAMAVIVPAVASASTWTKDGRTLTAPEELVWYYNGVPLTGGGLVMGLTGAGSVTLESSEYGMGIRCDDPQGIFAANPDSGNGDGGFEPADCHTTGVLLAICGDDVTSVDYPSEDLNVHTVRSGGNPAFEFEGYEVVFHVRCLGDDVPVEFSGDLVFTPINPGALSGSGVSMSGALDMAIWGDTLPAEASSSGIQLDAPNGAGIGLAEVATVPVSGTMGWMGQMGSMTCSASGTARLTVNGEGQLRDVKFTGCESGGIVGRSCNAATASGSWPLVDQGSYITVKNATITTACGVGSGTGDLTATPDRASAISSTSVAGTLKGELGSIGWSGSLSWDPAGVYGL
jgi:hypothetical protein